MTGHLPLALQDFYHQTWQLALTGPASQSWCQATTEHAGPPGTLALVPRGYIAPEWIALWPKLPDGEPGFVPTVSLIEDAYTKILRTNAPTVQVDAGVRRALHLAEQERDTAKLDAGLTDVVLQVAVFGWVVF